MITREQIEKIIHESVNAPSGDNSQPWSFRIHGNSVDIYNVERDQTIFNLHHRGDYVAHGALLENMGIVASEYGFHTDIVLFPNGMEKGLVATVTFKNDRVEKSPLFEAIAKRVTNRKPYKKEPLTEEQKKNLAAMSGIYGTARLVLVDDREGVGRIAHSVNLNERLILENKVIRDFLFSIIRWTDKKEQEKPGMHVRTLELAFPQRMAFRMFANNTIAGAARKMKLPSIMEKEGARLYEASGAIGAIIIKGNEPEQFVQAGRLLERTWLSAVAMGLYAQPLAAVPYLAQRIKEGRAEGLSSIQIRDVLLAERRIRDVFEISDNDIIAMVFRIGRADKPSAKSLKMKPEIIIK